MNLSPGVWVSINQEKHHKTSRRRRNSTRSRNISGNQNKQKIHILLSAKHMQEKNDLNIRCPRIYLLPCSGWSTISPPRPTVPVSIVVDRQGIVTIPGLGRPSRRPLPYGAMTSPHGRPEKPSGWATPTGYQMSSCICHAQQHTFCILKHFIATTKSATSPESPTVTSP